MMEASFGDLIQRNTIEWNWTNTTHLVFAKPCPKGIQKNEPMFSKHFSSGWNALVPNLSFAKIFQFHLGRHKSSKIEGSGPLWIQFNPWAQNVFRPWREPHRWVWVKANQTRESTSALLRRRARQGPGEGDGTNAVFMRPRNMKILGEGWPRGPAPWRGNRSNATGTEVHQRKKNRNKLEIEYHELFDNELTKSFIFVFASAYETCRNIWIQAYFGPVTVVPVRGFRHIAFFWDPESYLPFFFFDWCVSGCVREWGGGVNLHIWTAFFATHVWTCVLIKNLATLIPEKLQGLYRTLLDHFYTQNCISYMQTRMHTNMWKHIYIAYIQTIALECHCFSLKFQDWDDQVF